MSATHNIEIDTVVFLYVEDGSFVFPFLTGYNPDPTKLLAVIKFQCFKSN